MNEKRAAEMPGCGWRWKTKSRFSIAIDEPLEIAPRFPHSRSPGHYRDGKVEIQNQDSHFPTAHSSLAKNQKRKENSTPPVTLVFRLISGLENARRAGSSAAGRNEATGPTNRISISSS